MTDGHLLKVKILPGMFQRGLLVVDTVALVYLAILSQNLYLLLSRQKFPCMLSF
jgi:hypothetical protein